MFSTARADMSCSHVHARKARDRVRAGVDGVLLLRISSRKRRGGSVRSREGFWISGLARGHA